MFEQLHEYLILYKQLQVPGIGTFVVERKSAETDFPDKTIHAPVYTIALRAENSTSSKKFFTWLAATLNISDRDAIVRFNDFVFELKNGRRVKRRRKKMGSKFGLSE